MGENNFSKNEEKPNIWEATGHMQENECVENSGTYGSGIITDVTIGTGKLIHR